MIWKQVKDFPEFWVSDTGLVRRNATLLTPQVNSKGYLRVCTTINGKPVRFFVHRLVAQAFIPNPENKAQVNHKDGIKKHCTPDNLEWVTNQENRNHAVANGLHKAATGEATYSHKLTEQQIREIRERYVKNSRNAGSGALAKEYGVTSMTILQIVKREKWKHVQ